MDRLIAEKFVKTIYVLNGCEIFWNNWNYVPDSKVFLIDNYYGGVIERNLNYEYFMDNRKNFQQTYIWLEDEKSRKTMLDYLRGHIELTNFPMREVWKVADVENQYFPEDIIQLKEDEIFVDCGAYTGDTLEIFLEKSKGYKKYYALEPDKRRFQELNEKLRKNVIHVPVGAWYKKAQLSFSFESTCGEIVKEKRVELERIDADQIDNIIDNNEKVTFIKMDIEGAELSALYGAKETIERNKPTLAICVYHKREDLITIPQYIKKLVPEYKLYLRAHFPYASELVIYGIYE